MCDTFVALQDVTLHGDIIFGKNSDRPGGEVQDVIRCPARDYPRGSVLRCTYMEIPQLSHTYACVLSKPRWMWGAEMGANEHGLVIGNEAVWTNQAYRRTGLLGMDLLRLGLERSRTASEAVSLISTLLETFGQGGNCAEHFEMTYHNSFLIADPDEAWVLETASSYWVAERITTGTRSISNNLSIRGSGDLRHHKLDDIINEDQIDDFNFARDLSMSDNQDIPPLHSREGRVRMLCKHHEKEFNLETAQSILRDHHADICMHGDFETRGSQVSILSDGGCQHWFIQAPFPCQATYVEVPVPA